MTTMELRDLWPVPYRFPRTITAAVVVSILLHLAMLLIPMQEKIGAAPGGVVGPLQVELAPRPEQAPTVALPEPERAPAAPQPRRETIATAPRATPAPFKVPEPPPTPPQTETPKPREPVVDMAAFIAANRARRAEMDAIAARGAPASKSEVPSGLARNLESLSPDDGTGGVFQVLRIGARTGEFAFNGWSSGGTRRKWREVIEVDAGTGGDVERAIVRRMIALIREHYSGNFQWESRRQGKVVILSAAPQHNEELEEYLHREFFGTPTARRGR